MNVLSVTIIVLCQLGSPEHPSCWIATGLSARGVLYHAWLGGLVVKAVLMQDESILPKDLLRWKQYSKNP